MAKGDTKNFDSATQTAKRRAARDRKSANARAKAAGNRGSTTDQQQLVVTRDMSRVSKYLSNWASSRLDRLTSQLTVLERIALRFYIGELSKLVEEGKPALKLEIKEFIEWFVALASKGESKTLLSAGFPKGYWIDNDEVAGIELVLADAQSAFERACNKNKIDPGTLPGQTTTWFNTEIVAVAVTTPTPEVKAVEIDPKQLEGKDPAQIVQFLIGLEVSQMAQRARWKDELLTQAIAWAEQMFEGNLDLPENPHPQLRKLANRLPARFVELSKQYKIGKGTFPAQQTAWFKDLAKPATAKAPGASPSSESGVAQEVKKFQQNPQDMVLVPLNRWLNSKNLNPTDYDAVQAVIISMIDKGDIYPATAVSSVATKVIDDLPGKFVEFVEANQAQAHFAVACGTQWYANTRTAREFNTARTRKSA